MSRNLVFAANWKMHHDPAAAAAFASRFLEIAPVRAGRSLWFFPPSVSIAATASAFAARADISVGAQNVYWEAKGAFTGEISPAMVQGCGGRGALVGHSERRHVFGETDAETVRKVKALLAQRLTPMLCVGEKLAEREAGQTEAVVRRQLLAVLSEISAGEAAELLIAYEPVWAIGTGRVAKPHDASEVHRIIRGALRDHGVPGRLPVLYGGSVNATNVEGLLAEAEIDGVLVGGASLEAEAWAGLVVAGG
jgi:triosephosphate isomerase (TIM)